MLKKTLSIFIFMLSGTLFVSCSKNLSKAGASNMPENNYWSKIESKNASLKHSETFLSSNLSTGFFVFKNGLELLMLPDSSAPVVSYQTWVKVGSRHEIIPKTGLAHLFEHLMFKESKNQKEGGFDKVMERAGAQMNAATWVDWTYYYENVHKKFLPLVAEMEAERLENLTLTEKQVTTELEVVKNERRYRVDNNPNGLANEVFYNFALDKHPYRNPTIGYESDLEGLNRKDALDFYKTYYAPNNITIVVAGDFDPQECIDLVDKFYSHMKSSEIPSEQNIVEPPAKENKTKTINLDVSQSKLMFGYKSPEFTNRDHAVLDLLLEILFAKTSNLSMHFVEKERIMTHLSAWMTPWHQPGILEINATLSKGNDPEKTAQDLRKMLISEIEKADWKEDLIRAKNQSKATFLRAMKSASSKAYVLGNFHMSAGDYTYLYKLPAIYQGITEEDLTRVAKKYIVNQKSALLIVNPKKEQNGN